MVIISISKEKTHHSNKFQLLLPIHLFAEQDKDLSKVNTTTQIVVQVRLMLMKKLNLSAASNKNFDCFLA